MGDRYNVWRVPSLGKDEVVKVCYTLKWRVNRPGTSSPHTSSVGTHSSLLVGCLPNQTECVLYPVRQRQCPVAVWCVMAVTTVLESCSAGVSGREEDDETAAAALREMETRQASMASRRSEMLKEVE